MKLEKQLKKELQTKLNKLKALCNQQGLNFDNVLYNLDYDIKQLRFTKEGLIFGTKNFYNGKPCFARAFLKLIDLKDYV